MNEPLQIKITHMIELLKYLETKHCRENSTKEQIAEAKVEATKRFRKLLEIKHSFDT